MAIGVVDGLEVVDVQHQQQGGFAGAGDAVDLRLQHMVELAPVVQAGQGVAQRQLAQAVDDRLQIRHGILLRHLRQSLLQAVLAQQGKGSVQA